MTAEAGHHPGRVYVGQDGAFYLNSAPFYNAGGVDIAAELEVLNVLPGTKFFVDSVNGDDGNDGLSWATALATLDAAVNLCTASSGDRIYLAPWHAEDLAAADTVDLDVAGVEVIGLRRGNQMPTFSTTAAAGSITIDAANVSIRGIKLVANFATGTTTGLTITASGDGLTVEDCHFRDTSAANEFLVHISVATTVTDLTIRGCTLITLAGSMTNSILFAGTSSNVVIENNYFFVDSADDVVDHLTAASVNLVVRYNTIINQDTDTALYCLRYKSDGTGVAHDNRFAYNKVDAEVSVGAAAWWFENYATNTIGTSSGVLDPAAGEAVP